MPVSYQSFGQCRSNPSGGRGGIGFGGTGGTPLLLQPAGGIGVGGMAGVPLNSHAMGGLGSGGKGRSPVYSPMSGGFGLGGLGPSPLTLAGMGGIGLGGFAETPALSFPEGGIGLGGEGPDPSVPAGIAVVQATNNFNSVVNPIVITWPVATTAGSLLICNILVTSSSTITPPSGWTLRKSQVMGAGKKLETYESPNSAPRSTDTFAFSVFADACATAIEVSGCNASPFDQQVSATGISGTANPGTTGATSTANEISVYTVGALTVFPSSIDNGYTIQQSAATGGGTAGCSIATKILTATGTETANYTLTGSGRWGATINTYF